MKVLFVYRGIGPDLRNSVIDAQIQSFKELEVEILKYPISLGGFKGYLKAITGLKRFLKENSIDLIHAHYSYSGFISYLCASSKTICSLMGSDIYSQNHFVKKLTLFFSKYLWKKSIVKSERMRSLVPNSVVIPNGVNFDTFYPVERQFAIKETKFATDKKNIIFIAEDINSHEKNFILAKNTIELLKDDSVVLIPVFGKRQDELKYFYSSASLLLMTSLSEGSPNVIKEAMACNCPIVSTNVGDVKEVIGNTKGCFLVSEMSNVKSETSSTAKIKETSEKVKEALKFAEQVGRTKGRERIIKLGLDSATVARRIFEVYKEVLELK